MKKGRAILILFIFSLAFVLSSCQAEKGVSMGRTENGKFRRV